MTFVSGGVGVQGVTRRQWNSVLTPNAGDPLWQYVTFLLQFDDAATGAGLPLTNRKNGAAGSLYFTGTDEIQNVRTVAGALIPGVPVYWWTYQATGGASNRIITFPSDSAYAIPADFTIEAWVKYDYPFSSNPPLVLLNGYSSLDVLGDAWALALVPVVNAGGPGLGGMLPALIWGAGASQLTGWNTVLTQGAVGAGWCHVAVSRQAGLVRFFINGTRTHSGDFANAVAFPTGKISILGLESVGAGIPNSYYPSGLPAESGRFGGVRLTSGAIRYWADFAPDIALFPVG